MQTSSCASQQFLWQKRQQESEDRDGTWKETDFYVMTLNFQCCANAVPCS